MKWQPLEKINLDIDINFHYSFKIKFFPDNETGNGIRLKQKFENNNLRFIFEANLTLSRIYIFSREIFINSNFQNT